MMKGVGVLFEKVANEGELIDCETDLNRSGLVG